MPQRRVQRGRSGRGRGACGEVIGNLSIARFSASGGEANLDYASAWGIAFAIGGVIFVDFKVAELGFVDAVAEDKAEGGGAIDATGLGDSAGEDASITCDELVFERALEGAPAAVRGWK